MTLKELAALAGVSVSTASRVLNQNNSKAASEETKERIWRIARQNGYLPKANASWV